MQRRDRRSNGAAVPVMPTKGGSGKTEAARGARSTETPAGYGLPAKASKLDEPIPFRPTYREGVSDAEASSPRPRAGLLPQTLPVFTAECEGLKLVSPNRLRGFTRGAAMAQAARVKRVRELGFLVTKANVATFALLGPVTHAARVVVTITRVAPRFFDDDNFVSSCKPLRDGIADAFGLKDNDPRIVFFYDQAHGKPRQYAVVVKYQLRNAA